LTVELPSDFPMKYKKALLHTIDLCTVKRHLFDPPEFVLDAVTAE
jgi:ribosomal protein S12 methylthiotransferase accessory factor